jgi:hypothetical protein
LPPLAIGEQLIGVYENEAGTSTHAVAITDGRLLVECGGRWDAIRFADIGDVALPENKAGSDRLVIREISGREIDVRVSGRQGRFRDVFEFSRFLLRVASAARAAG